MGDGVTPDAPSTQHGRGKTYEGHEQVIAEALLHVALEEARKHGASRVRALRLEIGDLEGVEPRVLQDSFDVVARGTSAAGAKLMVDAVASSQGKGVEGLPLHPLSRTFGATGIV